MAFTQYTLQIIGGGPVVCLSSVYGPQATPMPAYIDVSYRQLLLQAHPANGTALYIGDNDLTAPDNSAFVLQPGPGNVQLITLGPFTQGALRLSDLWAVGLAGGNPRLLISGIPY
jgi:hypothetical protein